MARSRRCFVLFMVFAILLTLTPPDLAKAWKPYTHNFTGDRVWDDVVADGTVTINGRSYAVRPEIVAALRDHRSSYNAGVVGPDGFPDLTFGQAIIHPVKTGKWLARIYVRAWQAQSDPSYSPEEKSQILAFMYGYLTHAAGDMWAHTLINDLSGKVFPAVGDILTHADDAEVAIRHIILEGYIGDATQGYDGNDERDAAPGGDISDDSTPGVPFDAPHRFVYETFINPQAPSPLCDGEDDDYDGTPDDGCPSGPAAVGTSENSRGPLIDFFLNLRAQLVAVVSSHPMPVQAALDKFKGLKRDLDSVKEDCDFDDVSDVIDCPASLAKLGFNVVIKSAEAFAAFVKETLKAAVKVVFDAYLRAWIDDIDDGLVHWNELGLASTRAFFDPQARRNTQNAECGTLGSETDAARINCEDGIGVVDTLLHESDPFINDHLLSMLGAPDFVGELRETLQELADLLDEILAPLNIALNPIRNVLNDIKEFAKDLVKDLIKDAYGIDIDQINDFIKHPSNWLNVESVSVTLPELGTQTIHLFTPGTHDRLDTIMNLPADHHVPSDFPTPGASTRLSDDAVFDTEHFAPLKNTITMGKLLLLEGGTLNHALGDELVAQSVILDANAVQTYPASVDGFASNIMIQGLDGSKWLQLIDGDHAWRSDGKPRFCSADVANNCADPQAPNAVPRPAQFNGGNGQFPIWESCVLRPAFRGIFTDWENGDLNFPALGDAPSADPTDSAAPTSDLLVSGHVFGTVGDVTYIGPQHALTLSGQDLVFAQSQLQLEYRVYKDGTAPGPFSSSLPQGSSFSIPTGVGGFGLWHVDVRAGDPCHSVDALAPDAFITKSFFVSSRVTDGLLASYPFDEGTGTTAHDFSGTGTPLDLQIANPAAVAWVPGGLSITAPTVLASAEPATKITRAVSDTNELTLEAWIQPAGFVQDDPSSIVTLATDTISRDVTLAQTPTSKADRNRYEVRLRTSRTSRNGRSVQTPATVLTTNLTHVVYTRDAFGVARLFINGVIQREQTIAGNLSAWREVRLALANELNGQRAWFGTYQLVAFYNRALSPAEVKQNFESGAAGDGNPSTIAQLQSRYDFEEGAGTTAHDTAGSGAPLDLQIANPAATAWVPGGLVISATTLLSSTIAATRLTRAITGTDEVALEAWVRPASAHQETLARILTLSNDAVRRNIELVQERREGHEEAHFTVRLRTTDTSQAAKPELDTPDNTVRLALQHVVYTRDALGVARIYINGVKVAERNISGDFTNWDASYHLLLGNTLTGDRPWLGEYQRIAIYNRSLSPAEISRHFTSGPSS